MTHAKQLTLKGINYDTGTAYGEGYSSRQDWHPDLMQQEIRVIRTDLHCNTISIYGSDIDRMICAAETALDCGLYVWLQPRLINSSPQQMLAHLSQLAQEAEKLRQQHEHVTLNIGCELSIFMGGLIPGDHFLKRIQWLKRMWWLWMLLPRFNHKLNAHLNEACTIARKHFQGQISYAAGIWETVDWQSFDYIGLNYYREATNKSSYVSDLRAFHRFGKPIVITEFGCCSFEGADRLGGAGDSIVDYTKDLPKLKGYYQRNEKIQADYILDLLSIYQQEGIYGAFVFEFTEPSHLHSDDPLEDLDMASYGIVKVSNRPWQLGHIQWQPKQAFHEVAAFYQG